VAAVKSAKEKNEWFTEVEKKLDERLDENTGEPFFQYTNGDPIPLDWCLVMRLDKKNKPDELPDEVKEVVERLVGADLYVRHHISIRQDEIYIQVGAVLTQMLNEATNHMVIQMPVRGHHPARGTIPFHFELCREFQTEEEYLAGKEFRFHSGLRQRIIMNLIKRLARVNPEEKVLAPNRVKLLKSCRSKADKGKGMQRWAVKELLEANLCTTMTSNEVKTRARLPKCMEIYKHILDLEEQEISAQGSSNPGERVSLEQCKEIIAEIDAADAEDLQKSNSGFICEMLDFYPLHDWKELQHLLSVWADWSNMWRWKMPYPLDEGTHIVNAWAMFYQPTSKVRDYFGDHVALYFAWLQLYTQWLRFAALVGAFVMFGNYYGDNGIDGNPFVLAYSIFLSLWSTMFVEAWTNRENELRFLWGSAGFEAQEQPRPQFRGVIREDPVTKVKMLVHESDGKRYMKTSVSQTIILGCIMLVIFGAYGAYAIRQIKKVAEESCVNPCHQLQLDWESTNQRDDWTNFDFVMEKQSDCESIFETRSRFGQVNFTASQSDSFCTFSRPAPGAENGACVESTWWLNGTMCAGDRKRFDYDEDTMPKGSREYAYRNGADISDESSDISRENCELATGVRGDCIYTPFMLDGVEINPTWWERNKWKLLSSLINLILIQGGGQVYERLAGFLNEWENHRTETEYTDSLIFKAFGFQFVNNYFTLFYIAFLIHFQIFPGMKTGCDGHSSCMGELQWQLFIVFTGKTIAKKIVEISKPFIRSCVKGFGAKKVARTNQVLDTTGQIRQDLKDAGERTADLVTGSPMAIVDATRDAAVRTANQATQLATDTANRTVALANDTATRATQVVSDIVPGTPRSAAEQQAQQAMLMSMDVEEMAEAGLFSEPCERERWLDRYGDRRFPGTFYDFKDMAIQFGESVSPV
jgi:hypothetical protein